MLVHRCLACSCASCAGDNRGVSRAKEHSITLKGVEMLLNKPSVASAAQWRGV